MRMKQKGAFLRYNGGTGWEPMIIHYKKEELNQILSDFHKLTNMTISLWDAEFNQLTFYPTNMPSFCKIIKNSKIGNLRCTNSDRALCKACSKNGKPVVHRCHAGLLDMAAPIIHENTVLGYFMFGQIDDKRDIDTFERIWNHCKDLKVDRERLRKAYMELKPYEMETVFAAMRLLQLCAHSLFPLNMIEVQSDQLASEIDAYISAHLRQPLSVTHLCDVFHISKNRLYSVFRSVFNDTINNYIQKKRVETAKHLLISVNEPVYNICAMIGIDDYNYFTKVFKRYTGITPKSYQKTYPHNLTRKNKDDG